MNYRWIRNRQRLLALLLMGSMLAAAGCGASRNTEEKPEAVQKEEQTEQDTEQQVDDGQPELYPAVPKIMISSETVDNFDPESGQWLLHAEYNTVEAEGSETVVSAIQQWSDQREKELQALITQLSQHKSLNNAWINNGWDIIQLLTLFFSISVISADTIAAISVNRDISS